jgi:micrococcal nuclease
MKNNKTPKYVILAVILIIIILIISAILLINSQKPAGNNITINPNQVIRIIDGDTFELANGEIIRLICIDTPEKGKKGAEEASEFLAYLILNKEVRLEKDIDDKDEYGRLLRYVYINDSGNIIFINKEIIKNNYGTLFPYGNNTKKCGEINVS